MSEGWISVHRGIQQCWIWENEKNLKWWITILLNVNHSDKKYPIGHEINICRSGQSFRSLEGWTELFSCSKKTTIKFFEMLKKDSMISTEVIGNGNRRKLLLTVLNWDKYQQPSTERIPDFPLKEYPTLPPNNNDNNDNNDNKEEVEDKNKGWRDDFEIYLNEATESYEKIIKDADFIKDREKYHPNIDIKLSLEKSFKDYWSTEAAWSKRKKGKSKTLDWLSTFRNSLDQKMNQVYKPRQNQFSQQPTSTEEKECKWECQAIGLYRKGTYQQYLADVKRNNNQEVKFLGYVE